MNRVQKSSLDLFDSNFRDLSAMPSPCLQDYRAYDTLNSLLFLTHLCKGIWAVRVRNRDNVGVPSLLGTGWDSELMREFGTR